MAVSFRWFLVLIYIASFSSALIAQVPTSATLSLPADQLPRYTLPAQNNQALLDQELEERQSGRAPRFATPVPVRINPAQDGRWDSIGQLAIWRLRLYSPGAHSLNLGFTHYQMPEGGQLYLYDPTQAQKQGPFTPADNESHNQLWTPVFPGDELIVEIRVPSDKKSKLGIELSVVNHDFLGLGQLNSGSCNLDIVCSAVDGWSAVEPFRDAARSVGMYSIRGISLCTGFLVNNTRQDCTPYFLTANHCDISNENAASVVVYWNFENSTCRQPDSPESGANGNGSLDTYNTGAIFRSSWFNTDFCLIELDDPVTEAANAYFAGWTAENTLPEGTVASIHHPLTEEKRISLSNDVTHFGFWGSDAAAAAGNHIIINSWSVVGTTQSGSSGGPLFNARGQAIGQLHGGNAACDNDLYDSFGRIYNSWEGGGTPDSRLKDWLDPIGLNRLSLNGRNLGRCDFSVIGTFTSESICIGETDTLTINFGNGFESLPEISIGNISPELNITLESIPGGDDDSVRMRWLTNENTPAGKREFEVYAAYDGQTDTSYISLNILAQSPDSPVLQTPPDLAVDQGLKINFSWGSSDIAERYLLQLADTPDFASLIADQIVDGSNQAVVPELQPNTTYYWRVAAENICGLSAWSANYSFSTADIQCATSIVADTPIEIPLTSSTIESSMELNASGTIASVEIKDIDIKHEWVGDLSLILRSPSGTEVALMDRPGFPANLFGCDNTDLFLNFNQDIGNDYQDLENTCGSNAPAISGTFKPIESLEILSGEPARGTWTLIVKDQADEDGGTLVSWSLNICTIPEEIPLIDGLSEIYAICKEDSLQLQLAVSESFTGESVSLSIDPLPPGASFSFSKNPALPGDTVSLLLDDFSIPGSYSLQLTATDGLSAGSFPFGLEISDNPAAVQPESPADGAILSVPNITFSWDISNAAYYRLELANDPEFTTALQTIELETTSYAMELPEQEGVFFWRVVAINDCGESKSAVSSFQFSTSAVSDLQDGRRARVYPNPFGDIIYLEFSQPLDAEVSVRLLDINGRVLRSDSISRGKIRKQFSPPALSAGIYLLEFEYKGKRFVHRLVKSID